MVFLQRTRAGRNLYAIGGNREAAYLAGIAVDRYLLLAYTMSGTLAAVSGVLLASRLNSATVQLGNDSALLAISAALIGGASLLGGRGRIFGAFLGVLALGMLTNGMNLLGVTTYAQIAVRALILITVVAVDAFSRTIARRRAMAAADPDMHRLPKHRPEHRSRRLTMARIAKIATTSLATLEDTAPPFNLRYPNPADTLKLGLSMLDAAGAQGADLAVLPEGFMAAGLPATSIPDVAEPLDGPSLQGRGGEGEAAFDVRRRRLLREGRRADLEPLPR